MEKNHVSFSFLLSSITLRKAIKKFWFLRDQGNSENEAAAACWKAYKGVHLVDYKEWTPTKGNPGARRGPVTPHFRRNRKRGRKLKVTPVELKFAKQKLRRQPRINNATLAQHINGKYPQFEQNPFLLH